MQMTLILWATAAVNFKTSPTLTDRATACGMEVSTEKSKIMNNSMNIASADISMNSQKLEQMTSSKYLGAAQCKSGTCSAEVFIRIALAMARLNRS